MVDWFKTLTLNQYLPLRLGFESLYGHKCEGLVKSTLVCTLKWIGKGKIILKGHIPNAKQAENTMKAVVEFVTCLMLSEGFMHSETVFDSLKCCYIMVLVYLLPVGW